MAMNNINGSQPYSPSLVDKFAGTPQAQERAGEAVADKDKATARQLRSGDKAEISDAARNLMDLRQAIDAGRAAMEALPDIRQDKVDEAKTRLDQGYYNSVEVRDQVAERLQRVIEDMDQL